MGVPDSVVIELPNDATAPSLARSLIADHGAGLPAEVVDDAELLVSELVTNALCHGRPSIKVRLYASPPQLGVSVDDEGDAETVTPRLADPTQSGGRGLFLVASIASAWGVTPHVPPPGKTVWFEVGGPANMRHPA